MLLLLMLFFACQTQAYSSLTTARSTAALILSSNVGHKVFKQRERLCIGCKFLVVACCLLCLVDCAFEACLHGKLILIFCFPNENVNRS